MRMRVDTGVSVAARRVLEPASLRRSRRCGPQHIDAWYIRDGTCNTSMDLESRQGEPSVLNKTLALIVVVSACVALAARPTAQSSTSTTSFSSTEPIAPCVTTTPAVDPASTTAPTSTTRQTVQPITPQMNAPAPELTFTLPPTTVSAPPLTFTTPPTNVSAPPLNYTLPSTNVSAPPLTLYPPTSVPAPSLTFYTPSGQMTAPAPAQRQPSTISPELPPLPPSTLPDTVDVTPPCPPGTQPTLVR